ncbi:response regulator transcription factor [Rhodoluna limnophila]|uniref:response regulator transcription factor n=1 Tax=Rhodoluna limnophila TaxID=232537 RepID=UPI0011070468|nr:response regulator transcription factor [Rhodoluna limnophila]
MPLRIAVIEDDALTRLTLVAALNQQGFEVSFQSGSASDAVRQFDNASVDVALIDLHLGQGPTGVDLARAFRRKRPGVGLVFLTSFDDPRLLSENLPIFPSNAQYLTKKSVTDISILAKAVNEAALGKARKPVRQPQQGLGALTDGQIEIMRLVAQGLTNSEIAKRRFITEKSVELAVARVARALGLVSSPEQNQRVHIAKVFFKATGGSTREDA